jgi:hypothetical protein
MATDNGPGTEADKNIVEFYILYMRAVALENHDSQSYRPLMLPHSETPNQVFNAVQGK